MFSRSRILSVILAFFIFTGSLCLSSCSMLRSVESEVESESENKGGIIDDFSDTMENDITVPNENRIEETIMTVEREIRSEAVEWIELYNEKYGDGKADEIILSEDEIEKYNSNLREKCHAMNDMKAPPKTVSGKEVREEIERYSFPNGDKYDKHKNKINDDDRKKIGDNRNLDSIPETVEVKYGIITDRCDLKGFPTELGFYDGETGYYSAIQECELITGLPVLILHESSDKSFCFVRSYYYAGWIKSSCAAESDFDTYLTTAFPDSFITVLEPEIKADGSALSMGCKLPYVSEDTSSYTVKLPKRDDNGSLYFSEAKIEKAHSCYGNLEYTMKNYYRQTFAYLDSPYCWGGEGGGVDCSGFVCAVFRTFGIYLPRNTGEQEKYNGEVISFASVSAAEALDKISVPASVHRKGHVMLYLGSKNGKYYVIHAPQGGETVSVMQLSVPGNLTNVCVIK